MDTLAEMSRLDDDEVLDHRIAAGTLHRDGDSRDLDQEVAPKGLRLLHRVHQLPAEQAAAVADHFGGLAKLQRATVADLMGVDGVDEAMAVGHQGHPRAGHRVDDPRPVQLSRDGDLRPASPIGGSRRPYRFGGERRN